MATLQQKVDYSYIASFIDGEGCLTTVTSNKKGRDYCILGINLVITNTDLLVLRWIKDTLGCGRISEKKYEAHRKTRCWVYVLGSNCSLISVFETLYPYMKVKRRQAKLALSFLKSRERRSRRSIYSEEELRSLFELRRTTQRFNSEQIKYKDTLISFEDFNSMVMSKRKHKNYVLWTKEMEAKLGFAYDKVLAERFGITRDSVAYRRRALGIPSYRESLKAK